MGIETSVKKRKGKEHVESEKEKNPILDNPNSENHTKGRKQAARRRPRRKVAVSPVQKLYDTCKQVFSTGVPGIVPPPDKIEMLSTVLDGIRPEDVGLHPEMPYFRAAAAERSPPIRYLHLHECNKFSIGIFCFPPSGVIPLHNHPGMTVFSKLLFGKMHIKSYDWVNPSQVVQLEVQQCELKQPDVEQDEEKHHGVQEPQRKQLEVQQPEEKLPDIQQSEVKQPDVQQLEIKQLDVQQLEIKQLEVQQLEIKQLEVQQLEIKQLEVQHPLVRLAKVEIDSDFTAPCKPSILYPAEGGNMHCFTAATACALLDVLGPPYSDSEGRLCTYYNDFPFANFSDDGVSVSEEEKEGYAWLEERWRQPQDFKMIGEFYRGPQILKK